VGTGASPDKLFLAAVRARAAAACALRWSTRVSGLSDEEEDVDEDDVEAAHCCVLSEFHSLRGGTIPLIFPTIQVAITESFFALAIPKAEQPRYLPKVQCVSTCGSNAETDR